jgi:hypothetical protein
MLFRLGNRTARIITRPSQPSRREADPARSREVPWLRLAALLGHRLEEIEAGLSVAPSQVPKLRAAVEHVADHPFTS